MPRIIPINALKNTGVISQMCHQTNEPVFITKNGYGNMVIMSLKTYERTMSMLELHQKLMEAEVQLASGVKPLTVEEVFDGYSSQSMNPQKPL